MSGRTPPRHYVLVVLAALSAFNFLDSN